MERKDKMKTPKHAPSAGAAQADEGLQELLTLIRKARNAASDTLDPNDEEDEVTETDLVKTIEQLIGVLSQVDKFLEPGDSPNYARIIEAAEANDIDDVHSPEMVEAIRAAIPDVGQHEIKNALARKWV
jgi:hypothetical protein